MTGKKIAIVGAHCTGKTSLALALTLAAKEDFPRKKIGMLSENAPFCPLDLNERATPEAQLWVMCDQIKSETERSQKYDLLVCDRSSIDPLAYAMALYDLRAWKDERLEDFIDMSTRVAEFHAKTYDAVVYLKADEKRETVDDGFRSTDREFRSLVDKKFDALLLGLWDKRVLKQVDWYQQGDSHPEICESVSIASLEKWWA
jgi:deoxyadenosine/deoxycytidine kinase